MRLKVRRLPAVVTLGLAVAALPASLPAAPLIYHSLEEANAAAAREGRPVLLDFFTPW